MNESFSKASIQYNVTRCIILISNNGEYVGQIIALDGTLRNLSFETINQCRQKLISIFLLYRYSKITASWFVIPHLKTRILLKWKQPTQANHFYQKKIKNLRKCGVSQHND